MERVRQTSKVTASVFERSGKLGTSQLLTMCTALTAASRNAVSLSTSLSAPHAGVNETNSQDILLSLVTLTRTRAFPGPVSVFCQRSKIARATWLYQSGKLLAVLIPILGNNAGTAVSPWGSLLVTGTTFDASGTSTETDSPI